MTSLHETRDSLLDMLALNASANVDRIARKVLDGLDAQARRYLSRIAAELSRGVVTGPRGMFTTNGAFGANGFGPAIADIISQSERHRVLGKRSIAA